MTVRAILFVTSLELNGGLLRVNFTTQIPPGSSDGGYADVEPDATNSEINAAVIASAKGHMESFLSMVFEAGDVIRIFNTVLPFDVPVVTEV